MNDDPSRNGPYALAQRISQAINQHDLETLAECFTADYESVWPLHPARTFSGTEQVRRNWGRIFGSVPDVQARIVRHVVAGDDIWSEWEYTGTRLDGGPFHMRGVIILTVHDGRATSGRFYLEPVEADPADADAAVRELVGAGDPDVPTPTPGGVS